ncbi:MAG: hypothetical protein K1X74_15265 [Pirellulales bacterium]|nr:hypothetical protein [Pirellulales bacterium]
MGWFTIGRAAMISLGSHFRGPELDGSRIEALLRATGRSISKERGPWVGTDDFGPCDPQPKSGVYFEKGSTPAINVVFYVPGSLGDFDIPKIEASRFSRKQKLLLVAVPVPKAEVESGGSVEFVIGALQEANRIAAETFAKKGTEPFDLEKAEAIVEKVKQTLVHQGF